MSDKLNEQKVQIGWDAIVGDVFGINLRSIKTLWISFKSPKLYFDAAQSKNWFDKYTPSFRLWFSILALIFLLKFFWAGTSSSTFQSAVAQIEAQGGLPKGISPETVAKEHVRWTYAYLPVLLAILYVCLAWLYNAWGEKLNFPLRLRKVFVTIIPGSAVSVFSMGLLGTVSGSFYFLTLGLMYGLSFVFDSLTAFRGAFPLVNTKWGKLWRALSIGTACLATSFLAGLLSNLLAALTMYVKYS